MKLTLGFSPCPNDTFIFDALVNKKINTGDFDFDVVLEDVQTLNNWAAQDKLDVTKLSFPALFAAQNSYAILSAGAALGKGVGPLLISKNPIELTDVEACSIAIPGINTTAAFLLKYAFPKTKHLQPTLFSAIEDAVLNGSTDLGVLIHENRFTYEQKGLLKVLDLGDYWEQKTGTAIPLGCIAVKKSIDPNIQRQLDRLIKKSLAYAFQIYPTITPYVKEHAQTMDETVMRQHIELYVNDFSLDLGVDGRRAIEELYKAYLQTQPNAPATAAGLFVTQ